MKQGAFGAALAWFVSRYAENAGPHTVNPSFDVSRADARGILAELKRDPQPLPRPVVIISGFIDPHLTLPWWTRRLRETTRATQIIPVQIGYAFSFDACRRKVLAAIGKTAEAVDVIGISLGGLVARDAAAADQSDTRRLMLRRLYTVGSPHTGVELALDSELIQFHRDMQPLSPLVQRINAQAIDYELNAYVHLCDEVVGQNHAAPAGMIPWWLSDGSNFSPHIAALVDERILADIVLRLRGLPPLTREPPTPMPIDHC